MEQLVARKVHSLEAVGSNPTSAPNCDHTPDAYGLRGKITSLSSGVLRTQGLFIYREECWPSAEPHKLGYAGSIPAPGTIWGRSSVG